MSREPTPGTSGETDENPQRCMVALTKDVLEEVVLSEAEGYSRRGAVQAILEIGAQALKVSRLRAREAK